MTRISNVIILFTLLALAFDGCLSTTRSSSRDRILGRQRRTVSEMIRSCKHWKRASTDEPTVADVIVRLHNSASSLKKMSAALSCPTMRKLREPKLQYKVTAGGTKVVLFSIAVSFAQFHYDTSVREHSCLLSTWTEDRNSYVTCKIAVSVWPNGLFYYKCKDYAIGQLSMTDHEYSHGTEIKLHNNGEKSLFIVNSTCEPAILTLTHINKYKRLEKGEDWTLEFPASCDGRMGVNYKGECKVKVFHICLKTTTFIKEIKFHFEDGEIEECEHRKSEYTAYTPHWLPAMLGMNDLTTAILVPVVFFLIVANAATLTMKFFLTALSHGVAAANREFHHRFHNIFQARLVKYKDSISDALYGTQSAD